jgi:methyl-accepting chemotaxis protein
VAADEIVNLVSRGLKVSKEAGEKSKMLVPDIEKTTQLIKEIAAASMEQKTGADQINQAMQQLNMITQENASSSDELTQSSEQLSELAASLQKAVSIFNIGEEVIEQKSEETKIGQSQKHKTGIIADEKNKTTQAKTDQEKNKAKQGRKEPVTKKPDIGNLGKEFDLDDYEKF